MQAADDRCSCILHIHSSSSSRHMQAADDINLSISCCRSRYCQTCHHSTQHILSLCHLLTLHQSRHCTQRDYNWQFPHRKYRTDMFAESTSLTSCNFVQRCGNIKRTTQDEVITKTNHYALSCGHFKWFLKTFNKNYLGNGRHKDE